MPEFDKYASGYTGGLDVPILRAFGESVDQFIYVKALWLWNYLNRGQEKKKLDNEYKLLDYGCGTADMLKWLVMFGFPGGIHGADVSEAMLAEAEKRWSLSSKPLFSLISETETKFADNYFSCVVATCVFHHIEPAKRNAVLQQIKRILEPGGMLVIFEHNPLNLLTRLIVRRAAVDKNAVLLYPSEIKTRYKNVQLNYETLDYVMFFPPKIKGISKMEQYLSWCPLGGQYAIVGRKQN